MEVLQYNTDRTQLIIPEYGRHVQIMVNQLIVTQGREERNQMSKAIIGIMGNMNPHLRDVPDLGILINKPFLETSYKEFKKVYQGDAIWILIVKL